MPHELRKKDSNVINYAAWDFTSPLWSYIGNVESGPKAIAMLSIVPIGMRLIARVNIAWSAVTAFLLLGCALIGCLQYRRNRRSLRAILLLFQLNGWPLAIALGVLGSGLSYLTGSHEFYAKHWLAIALFFLLNLIAFTFYYTALWRDGQDQYRMLGAYRPEGRIPASELYRLLTFQGRSTRMLSKLALIVGVSVPITTILAVVARHVIGRDVREFLAYVISLTLSSYIMSILIARRWLQHRYLGVDDLLVVE